MRYKNCSIQKNDSSHEKENKKAKHKIKMESKLSATRNKNCMLYGIRREQKKKLLTEIDEIRSEEKKTQPNKKTKQIILIYVHAMKGRKNKIIIQQIKQNAKVSATEDCKRKCHRQQQSHC